jgi:hypothetical protein
MEQTSITSRATADCTQCGVPVTFGRCPECGNRGFAGHDEIREAVFCGCGHAFLYIECPGGHRVPVAEFESVGNAGRGVARSVGALLAVVAVVVLLAGLFS